MKRKEENIKENMKICRKLNNKYGRAIEIQTNNKWNNNMPPPQRNYKCAIRPKRGGEKAEYWKQNAFIIM